MPSYRADQLIANFISRIYGPLLMGEDAADVQALWKKLYHYPGGALDWAGGG